MALDESIRHQLAVLARASKTRVVEFTSDRPSDWRPHQVRNPAGLLDPTFTDASAWEFIADQLESGQEVEEIVLEHPPGKVGYVMKIELEADCPRVYIKLELGSGAVFGRSFHYSEYEQKQ